MAQTHSRRIILLGSMAAGAAMVAGQAGAQALGESIVRNNISAFKLVDWRDHFDSLKGGVIIADTSARVVQFWSEDESIYKIYPSSVPLSDDLTRLGHTEVIRKVEGPSWTPTPAMRLRNPEWPAFVPPGPDNPLGTHALYLSWQYYRIHGTHDTRKIGRKSSNGCIGLYTENIAELFGFAKVGTQVKLIRDNIDPERARAGMKITKTFGIALAVACLGAGFFIFARSTSEKPAVEAVVNAPAIPGAAMVEVRLPATLSKKALAGQTYFDAACASCHGANAAGLDGVAPPLVHKIYEPSHHGDAAFLVAVRGGARQHHWSFGSMLPVEQKLTDGEIAAIILYVRELQRENGIM